MKKVERDFAGNFSGILSKFRHVLSTSSAIMQADRTLEMKKIRR